METLVIALSLTGLIFGVIGSILGINALITVKAMEKSTHTLVYKPVDEEIDRHNQEISKQWATKDEVLEKDKTLYKEELEETMPELAQDEEDQKTYSF